MAETTVSPTHAFRALAEANRPRVRLGASMLPGHPSPGLKRDQFHQFRVLRSWEHLYTRQHGDTYKRRGATYMVQHRRLGGALPFASFQCIGAALTPLEASKVGRYRLDGLLPEEESQR